VIPDKKIFCNTPWFETHIYWNGDFGICCQESKKLYDVGNKENYFNIKHMSILEWFNSDPVKNLRLRMWQDKKIDICSQCTYQEQYSNTSRRHKSNQKSVIFTKTAFSDSFQQSPHRDIFVNSIKTNGITSTQPMDLHVDLGNYCNLACKMCHAKASSKIASQMVKWGDNDAKQHVGQDWTKDESVWQKFIKQVKNLPLVGIHFMGGETLLTKRFHDFVDAMIEASHTNYRISFVTNGTQFDENIISKLKKFKQVGIEVSIESCTDANTYIRQGTVTQQVLDNINHYVKLCDKDNIDVTVRPAPSALSISSYYTLLDFCLSNGLNVKSNLVTRPEFLQIKVLPKQIRQTYKKHYLNLINKYKLDNNYTTDYNESNKNNYKRVISAEIEYMVSLLDSEDHIHADKLAKMLVAHCKKWDQVYRYNSLSIYPELETWLQSHGY